MRIRQAVLIICLGLGLAGEWGCNSYKHASLERARYLSKEGYLIPKDQIRTADFLNYYKQSYEDIHPGDIEGNLGVYLSCREAKEGKVLVQIGLKTPKSSDKGKSPLNLCIVVDKSGSMWDNHKMEYVKKAMELLINQLDEDDIVSIVTFDSVARVGMRPEKLSSRSSFLGFIRNIYPGGNTNLYDGLELGYEQVEKNLDKERINHLVMFTDAMLNTGEIDPEKVTKMSEPYHKKHIGLTLIGVGVGYNDQLMDQLSKQNQGNYFFLDSEKEIEKVLKKLLLPAMATVVSKLEVNLELKKGVELEKVYGYQFDQEDSRSYIIRTNPAMGVDSSQTILLEISISNAEDPLGHIQISYKDEDTKKIEKYSKNIELRELSAKEKIALDKNFFIAQEAEMLKAVWDLVQDQEYGRALRKIQHIKNHLEDICEKLEDSEMKDKEFEKDIEFLERYKETIIDIARRDGVNLDSKIPPTTDIPKDTSRSKSKCCEWDE